MPEVIYHEMFSLTSDVMSLIINQVFFFSSHFVRVSYDINGTVVFIYRFIMIHDVYIIDVIMLISLTGYYGFEQVSIFNIFLSLSYSVKSFSEPFIILFWAFFRGFMFFFISFCALSVLTQIVSSCQIQMLVMNHTWISHQLSKNLSFHIWHVNCWRFRVLTFC